MRTRNLKVDLSGKTFGLLTVNCYLGGSKWSCTCSEHPDKDFITTTQNLTSGDTKSCGCLKLKLMSERFKTHGMSGTKEYKAWGAIKDRCYNENNPEYKNYGGRGVSVCDRWLENPQNFLDDMGSCPSKNHSIDRINVNGNYCPENCRWATQIEQVNNARSNRRLTFDGKTKNVSEWAVELGFKAITLYGRLNRGWSTEKTLTTPAIKNREYVKK